MKKSYCTLFDSGYLDRGIALADSLAKTTQNYNLYIFAFDEISYLSLLELKLANVVVISEKEIRTKELEKIKTERSRGEYCWTCTPIIIKYVLENYYESNCTYIDSDMIFFSDPSVLVDEIIANNASIGLVEHRFPKGISQKLNLKYSGRFCVQFNTFMNDEYGRTALDWWIEKCIDCCTSQALGEVYGDQKYLDDWTERFKRVHVIVHAGAGVAPWNVSDYTFKNNEGEHIIATYQHKIDTEIIFYHYQALRLLGDKEAHLNVYNQQGCMDDKLIDILYLSYIAELYKIREKLRINYDIHFKEDPIKTGERRLFKGVRETIVYFEDVLVYLLRNRKNRIRID